MRLLCFQAKRFRWKTCTISLQGTAPVEEERELENTVVVFVHSAEEDEANAATLERKAAKHLKWMARKGDLKRIVLHSFTNLGAEGGSPEFAARWIEELAERLRGNGYEVATAPFGHQCEWDLCVGGESMAKVWKEL